MSNLSVHNLINSCLRIEQTRISRRHTIPVNINFDLNQEVLSQIISLRNNQQKIYLSPDNLANLRYFFLLNSSDDFGLGITFKTYYYRQEQKIPIIKSIIHLSGTAEQYIRHDAVDNKEILDTHYWLIEQILKQIPLKYKKSKLIIFWLLLGLITIILAPLMLLLIPWGFWANFVLLLFLIALISKILLYFIRKHFSSWVLEQLLFGIFSGSIKTKKFGLNLLAFAR